MGKSKYEQRYFAKSVAFGTLTSVIASIILLVLFSVFMMIQQMPSDSGFYISFVIIGLSALAGGFTGVGVMKCRGMMTGSVIGFAYIMLIALIGGAAGFSVNVFGTFLLKAMLSVLFGGIGGILRTNIRRR